MREGGRLSTSESKDELTTKCVIVVGRAFNNFENWPFVPPRVRWVRDFGRLLQSTGWSNIKPKVRWVIVDGRLNIVLLKFLSKVT